MRKLLAVVLLAFGLVLTTASVASAATIDEVGASLRGDPVYADPTAERAISAQDANSLRSQINGGNRRIFIAILPQSIAGGTDADSVLSSLHRATDIKGTYAVVVGTAFRAGSDDLRSGVAGRLATQAIDANRSTGTTAVLSDFIRRVETAPISSSSGSGNGSSSSSSSDNGIGVFGVVVLVLIVAGIVALVFFSVRRSRRRRAEMESVRQSLQADVAVLSDDVINLEDQVAIHPEAKEDYDAGVSRYRWVEAAVPHVRTMADADRVRRAAAEGHYAMARARAITQGVDPPPPPPDLTVPGVNNEPPIVIEDRRPVYAGYGGGWYGGGWFGGNDLFTGILIGQTLGGGWGGGWGGGGGGWSGNSGGDNSDGGDFGGGDFGGGDFGGGDFGGGDFGGGGDSGGGGDF